MRHLTNGTLESWFSGIFPILISADSQQTHELCIRVNFFRTKLRPSYIIGLFMKFCFLVFLESIGKSLSLVQGIFLWSANPTLFSRIRVIWNNSDLHSNNGHIIWAICSTLCLLYVQLLNRLLTLSCHILNF